MISREWDAVKKEWIEDSSKHNLLYADQIEEALRQSLRALIKSKDGVAEISTETLSILVGIAEDRIVISYGTEND